MDNFYHVTSANNPCDLGKRPEKVSLDDVGPISK